jgi:hypothetical protein
MRSAYPDDGPAAPSALGDDWRLWLAENMLRGVSDDALVATLLVNGVPPQLAAAEIATLRAHPTFVAALPWVSRARRLAWQVDTLGRLDKLSPQHACIERRANVSREEFLAQYYARNRPVVLTDVTKDWPARRWTPAHLREHYGQEPIEVSFGRNATPDCDVKYPQLARGLTLGEYVDLIESAGPTNDFYMVANSATFKRPGFAGLIQDLAPLPPFLESAPDGSWLSLWFGPASTVTPLHFDGNNILFCQLYGRKRVWMASPLHIMLLHTEQGYMSTFNPEAPSASHPPEFLDVDAFCFELDPGDVLFIPAGWWHQVRSLDTSISVSLLSFAFPNLFDDPFGTPSRGP